MFPSAHFDYHAIKLLVSNPLIAYSFDSCYNFLKTFLCLAAQRKGMVITMAKLTIEEIIAAIKELTALELNDMIEAIETEFGVSADTGMTRLEKRPIFDPIEEDLEFDVELTEIGEEKMKVIKVVRELTGLGLKEAKDLVDGAPKIVKEDVPRYHAEAMAAKFAEAGAKVTLR
jgi:large subunit ribosomal protein L7/L12